MTDAQEYRLRGWRGTLYEVIFEAETPLGRLFDIGLIVTILLSTLAVMLDSVTSIRAVYGSQIRTLEWIFTILFTIEYILRLLSSSRPLRYAGSFFGVVDLLAILPTYISLVVPGSHYLLVIRILRILRVFRVLKLAHYLNEGQVVMRALRNSRRKIAVFLFTVLALVTILGSLMYLIEGEANGFSSIPRGIYWAIVTLTTVGYGDITPQTDGGRFLAAIIMILGYGIIAVPTGIVTAEMTGLARGTAIRTCRACGREGHDGDAVCCKWCGTELLAHHTDPASRAET